MYFKFAAKCKIRSLAAFFVGQVMQLLINVVKASGLFQAQELSAQCLLGFQKQFRWTLLCASPPVDWKAGVCSSFRQWSLFTLAVLRLGRTLLGIAPFP